MIENAFAPNGWIAGLKLLALAGFAAWFYFRATKQDVFLLLAGALGLNALFTLIFFSAGTLETPSNSKIGAFLVALTFIPVYAVLTAIVCSKVYHELPRFNLIPADKIMDPDKGISPIFTGVMALVTFLILKLIAGNGFLLLESKTRGLGLDVFSYVFYLLIMAGVAFTVQYIIPFKETTDSFVVSETKLDSLDVFHVTEEASGIEKGGSCAALFFIFFLLPYFAKPPELKNDADIAGLVILGVIFALIVKTAFFSKK
ncbi:MAG: hypothetical protein LWY06_02145 [Firmicutes bacterium]|nr:hypothetical protein [Bacillota bacterium]